MSATGGKEPREIKLMKKDERDKIIAKLVFEKNISKTALEKVTGVSRKTITLICNKK